MGRLVRWIQGLIQELRRRQVIRVAVVYATTGFVVLQLAEILVDPFGLGPWALRLITLALILGFPLALGLAWVYNLTEEGVVPAGEEASGPGSGGSAFTSNGLIVGLLIVAIGLLLYPRVFYSGENSSGPSSQEAIVSDTTQRQDRQREEAASGPRKTPRIAVLPFENIAQDSTQAFFARGLHEEVLNQLAKVSGLELISRTSVLKYAETEKSVAQISKELDGIDALLEGTVRRAGDQLRITTQLIEAPEDTHLWSTTYDRELSTEAIFDIQADIAEQIADALETELTAGERRRIAEVPTSDLAAYDLFLRGRSQWWSTRGSRDPQNTERAIDALREAVRRDSTFAEAWAWLGLAYLDRWDFSGERRWVDSAWTASDRAYALDSQSATVLTVRGDLFAQRDSLDAAREALRRALELQPNDGFALFTMSAVHEESGNVVSATRWAHRLLTVEPRSGRATARMGIVLTRIGMLEAAEAWWQRLVELDPKVAPKVYLSDIHLLQGEMTQAQAVSDSALAQHPNHPLALHIAGQVALHANRPSEAKKYLARIPEARRDLLRGHSRSDHTQIGLEIEERMHLGLAELRTGDEQRGRRRLQAAADTLRALVEREQADRPDRLARRGGILATLGQTEEGLRSLERSAEEGFALRQELETSPLYDSLRTHPRFQELVGRVEANQQRVQEEVRQMGIPLYPPGTVQNEGGSEERPPAAQSQTDA